MGKKIKNVMVCEACKHFHIYVESDMSGTCWKKNKIVRRYDKKCNDNFMLKEKLDELGN